MENERAHSVLLNNQKALRVLRVEEMFQTSSSLEKGELEGGKGEVEGRTRGVCRWIC